ncbi:MAG: hypothetical protein HOE80_04735, partial [Candidatus Magasanikbacteria bacterium]|nr:hypothetical protein [Candidatus Magasanikbacteria bacterium]
MLDVPFLSQVPPGVWAGNANCGQTSILMATTFFNPRVIGQEDIKAVDDWIEKNLKIDQRKYNGSPTDLSMLKKIVIQHFHFTEDRVVVSENNLELNDLKNNLEDNNIMVVEVYTNMRKFGSADVVHYMVLTGIDDEFVYVNDPGKTYGKDKKYTIEQFLKAWSLRNKKTLILSNTEIPQQPPQSQSFWQELHDFFFGGFVFGWDNQSSVYDGPLRENAPVEPEEFEITEEEEPIAEITHGTIRTLAQTIHAQAEEIINI